jgi:hypothetical protein
VAQPETLQHAGRDRDDVLERARDFDADEVLVRVDAKPRRREDGLHRSRRLLRPRGRDDGGRLPAVHLLREARPREHREPRGGQQRLEDVRHERERIVLDALRRADDDRAGRDVALHLLDHGAYGMARCDGEHHVHARHGLAGIRECTESGGER